MLNVEVKEKIQIITTNKIIESPPILVLKTNKIIESVFKKYNIPDSLIDNIMSFQTGICNCFPFDVYSEYKEILYPFKNILDQVIICLEHYIHVVFMGVMKIYK